MGGRHLYSFLYLGQWVGFKWETTPWSSLQQRDCGVQTCGWPSRPCCPWDSTRLDSWVSTTSGQVSWISSYKNLRSTSSRGKKAVDVPCWEQRNRAGSHSKVSCQISHFIWLQSPCGWNVTSSSSGSFNSWHCCLIVPAQLCVMTTC